MSLGALESKILEMQSLMEAYATDGRLPDQPALYRELYIDIDLLLQQHGYANPNSYRTIEQFWEDCSGTWASRRRLIGEIYADVLLDIGRRKRQAKEPRNWDTANEALEEDLEPSRRHWLKAKSFIYSAPPDFENSIKESISAVESCLKILLDRPSSTLGQLVKTKRLDRDVSAIISKAYGLLSGKDSIRHGGSRGEEIGREEAEFFLEFCASAIIYIKSKLGGEYASQ